ncbi:hypothetical protein GCM10022222_79800 [Amycolatopsis ultiminotia]|uniref:Uncharacterized protein n=1 Tax=Amycolatopsis ultiminotia TaxID=543629 RepID=A0ABP6YGA8_9PSEU
MQRCGVVRRCRPDCLIGVGSGERCGVARRRPDFVIGVGSGERCGVARRCRPDRVIGDGSQASGVECPAFPADWPGGIGPVSRNWRGGWVRAWVVSCAP